MVFHLVTDIIRNSFGKSGIAFSPEVSDALGRLKQFNLERIYLNPTIKRHTDRIRHLFEILFEAYLQDLRKERTSSVIFTQYLKDISTDYVQRRKPEEIVRDFISGMTDQYFLRQCPESLRPEVTTL